jgi:KDO2-lipid IV(A) lauroyltransferase
LRPLRHALLLGLIAALDRAFRLAPLGLSRRVGSGLGRLFFRLIPYERRKTLAALERAFPDSSPQWRRATGSDVFAHLGLSAAEFFRMADMDAAALDAQVAEVSGFEHLERPVREGRGVIAVTAHLGHWELLAAWVAARVPVSVVARQAYDARLDAALTRRREQHKVFVFGRNTAVRPILKWLKSGHCLGVLCDQDTGVDSLFVEYFGRPAKTPSGAAVLAQSTGADLVTGFCFRRPDGRYRLEFGPAISVPPRDGRGAMALWDAVQEYTRRTEAAVRSAPGQWAWNHSRWRSDGAKASTGWDPRLHDACTRRIEAWRAAGRPPLA